MVQQSSKNKEEREKEQKEHKEQKEEEKDEQEAFPIWAMKKTNWLFRAYGGWKSTYLCGITIGHEIYVYIYIYM